MLTPRQNTIARASLDIIAEEGIHKFTIRNLAHKLELTEGAIFRHFKNKAAITQGVIDLVNITVERFAEFPEDTSTPLKKIHGFLQNMCKECLQDYSIFVILFSKDVLRGETDLSNEIFNINLKNQKYLHTQVIEAQNKGEIKQNLNAQHLMLICLSSVAVFIYDWLNQEREIDLISEFESMWETLGKLLTE